MSDYLSSLDPIARARYTEKLQLMGISEEEDPYLLWNGDKFVNDMTLWPLIEYGHTFCYFIERSRCFHEARAITMEEFGRLKLLSVWSHS